LLPIFLQSFEDPNLMANLSRLLLDSAPYITLVINGPGEIVIARPKHCFGIPATSAWKTRRGA
jgi:hypothetical protein